MIKTQLISTTVINKVLSGASLTDTLFECWQQHTTLSIQQKGAIQDYSYGVLRYYGQLNQILSFLITKNLQHKKIHNLLLVGLYQLLNSKTPPYTIINQAVSASRTITQQKKIPGLVNAVLRNFLRQKDSLLEQVTKNEVGLFSHPQWWIDKLRAQYPAHFHTILNANNEHPPMTLRVNQRKVSVADYQQLLSEHGMKSTWIWHSALMLEKPVSVEKIPGFHQGLVSVQDAGAQLAAPLLDVHPGMHVLDACAAPGSKSTHLLELADIALTVLDHNKTRLTRVQQNLERLHMQVTDTICADAANPGSWWNGKPFDRILADVPCSASGVARRHPDIKWLRRKTDLKKFAQQQQTILHALWQTLARNGKLLYVTCSVFMEENKWQTEQFLHHHTDAQVLPLHVPEIQQDGQLLPNDQHDGFFYSLLHKL